MIVVKITGKRLRVDTIKKLVEDVIKEKYSMVTVSVENIKPAVSRPARFSKVQNNIADALMEAECLRDEMSEWHDNLPESLQSGEKAELLEEAETNLNEIIDSLETAGSVEVEFPGMY